MYKFLESGIESVVTALFKRINFQYLLHAIVHADLLNLSDAEHKPSSFTVSQVC